MSLQTFCSRGPPNQTIDTQLDSQLRDLKNHFLIFTVSICIVGISGNILNLITLRYPSLQTVPFMYIRALAVFDICGLSAILIHYWLAELLSLFSLLHLCRRCSHQLVPGRGTLLCSTSDHREICSNYEPSHVARF
ncbi:hypothetical protein L596_002656 [Steinernema carpocapsae]|uniref:G-protein coupled receptors family 1 profile domain-containing protein n=1 Tax=Steinernema carpocapsae TaxID=34508 RepID=A0A4U8URP8_STECR|nr:hypothetical protein L596_002656 [Steinernema carpocapsae]